MEASALNTGMETYYDLRAQEYDDFYTGERLYADRDRPGWFADLAALERWIASLAPARVLDVACGTGFLTRHLRGKVTALDQSRRMLDVAHERVPDAELVQASGFALPFPDGAFERVFTAHFYGHLRAEQRRAFLSEAARVGGELVIVDAAKRDEFPFETVQRRPLIDGSIHDVYKRWFTGAGLIAELGGGRVELDTGWYVAVAIDATEIAHEELDDR